MAAENSHDTRNTNWEKLKADNMFKETYTGKNTFVNNKMYYKMHL